MRWQERFQAALSALPCPVNTPPGAGGDCYLVYQEVFGKPAAYRSNQPGRVRRLIQVHVFAKADDGSHRDLHEQAMRLIRGIGGRVFSWGPDDYEPETGYHHIACTVEWAERFEEE